MTCKYAKNSIGKKKNLQDIATFIHFSQLGTESQSL